MNTDEEEKEEKPKRFRECVCINCGYVTSYRKGIACYMRRCRECGATLMED